MQFKLENVALKWTPAGPTMTYLEFGQRIGDFHLVYEWIDVVPSESTNGRFGRLAWRSTIPVLTT